MGKQRKKSPRGRKASLLIRLLLLSVIGLAILLTLLLLVATSGKDLYGLVDPMVKWVPRSF